MSLSTNVSEKANLIWAIADKLTGVYKPHEYGEVILPLTVIRRFDSILEDTKEAVLAKYEQNDAFFVQLFSNPAMMKEVMETIGRVLYERLSNREQRYYGVPETLQMVAEENEKYEK